jgi:hypothetical protein
MNLNGEISKSIILAYCIFFLPLDTQVEGGTGRVHAIDLKQYIVDRYCQGPSGFVDLIDNGEAGIVNTRLCSLPHVATISTDPVEKRPPRLAIRQNIIIEIKSSTGRMTA